MLKHVVHNNEMIKSFQVFNLEKERSNSNQSRSTCKNKPNLSHVVLIQIINFILLFNFAPPYLDMISIFQQHSISFFIFYVCYWGASYRCSNRSSLRQHTFVCDDNYEGTLNCLFSLLILFVSDDLRTLDSSLAKLRYVYKLRAQFLDSMRWRNFMHTSDCPSCSSPSTKTVQTIRSLFHFSSSKL